MRRDNKDLKWKETKQKVFQRDNNSCRLCRVLTAKEFMILKQHAGIYLSAMDPAHFLAVSSNPELCYDENNICSLNHYSHSMLDDHKSPIDGSYIKEDEVLYWWKRILKGNPQQYENLQHRGLV